MLTVKGCSETALFREWSNEVFSQSLISQIHYLSRLSFFSKRLKFDVDSRNGRKN